MVARHTIFFTIIMSVFFMPVGAQERSASSYIIDQTNIAKILMYNTTLAVSYCALLKNGDTATCTRYLDGSFDCTISRWGDDENWECSKDIDDRYFYMFKNLYRQQQEKH